MVLDIKNKRILAILDQNARMTIKEIARRTRLNKDVVRYRMNDLEDNKVIKGYYTLIDMHKLGYMTIRIYFDLINVNKTEENKLIHYLDREFNAGQIFSIDGKYQLGIIIWENSVYDLELKLRNLKKYFGKFINYYEISVFTELHNYFRKYLPGSIKGSLTLKDAIIKKVDAIDIKILRLLSNNARLTSVDIANRLKIPQRTIAYRIKVLERNNIIIGYRANININNIDYENYFIEIYTTTNQNLNYIESFAYNNDYCIGVDYVLHGADIELEVEVPNKKYLIKFISELKDKFKDIKKIQYWSTLEYIKVNYFPIGHEQNLNKKVYKHNKILDDN